MVLLQPPSEAGSSDIDVDLDEDEEEVEVVPAKKQRGAHPASRFGARPPLVISIYSEHQSPVG